MKNKRILIVDDNELSRRVLRKLVEVKEHEAEEASDGIEALDHLERGSVDAIISDVLMPRMDGYELCRQVRHDDRFKDIPFILYTGSYTSSADEQLALDYGADQFLRKPAPSQLLLEALDALLSRATPCPQRTRRKPRATEDLQVMKDYSQALVRKLEQTNSELEAARAELSKLNTELEIQIHSRTQLLESVNRELDDFSQTVSHDLETPLRRISACRQMLFEDCGSEIGEQGRHHLEHIGTYTDQAQKILRTLLEMATVSRSEVERLSIDLSGLAKSVLRRLQQRDPFRFTELVIEPGLVCEVDYPLMHTAFEHLLGNAWKFTSKVAPTRIEFGARTEEGRTIYSIADNGTGFDMADAKRLFSPFKRLHAANDFPGAGMGLATVQRIIHRHGGTIWAESAKGHGAKFHFTLC